MSLESRLGRYLNPTILMVEFWYIYVEDVSRPLANDSTFFVILAHPSIHWILSDWKKTRFQVTVGRSENAGPFNFELS